MVRLSSSASPESPMAKIDRELAGADLILLEMMSDPALARSER